MANADTLTMVVICEVDDDCRVVSVPPRITPLVNRVPLSLGCPKDLALARRVLSVPIMFPELFSDSYGPAYDARIWSQGGWVEMPVRDSWGTVVLGSGVVDVEGIPYYSGTCHRSCGLIAASNRERWSIESGVLISWTDDGSGEDLASIVAHSWLRDRETGERFDPSQDYDHGLGSGSGSEGKSRFYFGARVTTPKLSECVDLESHRIDGERMLELKMAAMLPEAVDSGAAHLGVESSRVER